MHRRRTAWTTRLVRRTARLITSLTASRHHGQLGALPIRELLAREGATHLLALIAG